MKPKTTFKAETCPNRGSCPHKKTFENCVICRLVAIYEKMDEGRS